MVWCECFKSVMSSLILVKGRLFRMLSTSQNKVVNNSAVMVLPFVIDSSERLIIGVIPNYHPSMDREGV